MANVVIANPPWYYKDCNGEIRFGVRSGSRWPFTVDNKKDFVNRYRPFPFLLAYAHSLLRENIIDSVFIDSITLGDTEDNFFNKILMEHPKYVFFEISTPSYSNDMRIAKILYEKFDCKVLVGGTHASVFYSELIKEDFIHAVFIGEYEWSLLEFFKGDCSSGIYNPVHKDLDLLPFPYRDDSIWLYRERTHNFIPFQISMLTSRGCPFHCIFCQWPKVMYDNRVTYRSLSNIENEIKHLVSKYGEDIFIYIDDDTFNIKESRSIDISKIFAKYGLKWSAMCRIDTVSLDCWETLYKNGLICVNIGIESASQSVLNTIGKKLNIEQAEKTINFLNEIGMHIHLTFTFGSPGETEEDITITKEFFNRIKVASKQQSRCIPLPGTIWWNNLIDKNIEFDGYKNFKGLLDENRI